MTWILGALNRAAAARASRTWVMAPLVLLLWPYLNRLTARFDSLVTRWREGRLASPAPRGPHARTHRPNAKRLPQTIGWLIQLTPQGAGAASQLRHLFADPEMVALLDAGPQAGRLLRPLCRMLGIRPSPDLPASLFAPPRPATVATASSASAARDPADPPGDPVEAPRRLAEAAGKPTRDAARLPDDPLPA